jgi:hypothetical protein
VVEMGREDLEGGKALGEPEEMEEDRRVHAP